MSLDEDRLEPRLRDPESGAPTISEVLLHIKGYISVSHMSLRPFHEATSEGPQRPVTISTLII